MSIEKIAESILSQALYYQATDIHAMPRSTDYLIQFRIHGILTSHKKIPIQMGERVISHLKFLASMDIGERRKPQSGSLQTYISGNLTSLRISTLPTAKAKESIVIRVLHHKKILSQQKLSLFPKSMHVLQNFMTQAHGLLLLTGPTGSGKSTTMFTLADYCSKQLNRRVISLEDPVEQQNDHFVQVQVNEKAGVSFHKGLKAILRHDPDVILIGEIRDAETAFIAIRAALTGHLVLSTLHTRDAKGALYRLSEFGVKHHDLEQTLLAITSQRLVTLRCPFCGFACSKYCIRSQISKRTGVYELLHSQTLQMAMKELKGGEHFSPSLSLPKLIAKGAALGYISEEEYEKWIVDEKNIDKRPRAIFY